MSPMSSASRSGAPSPLLPPPTPPPPASPSRPAAASSSSAASSFDNKLSTAMQMDGVLRVRPTRRRLGAESARVDRRADRFSSVAASSKSKPDRGCGVPARRRCSFQTRMKGAVTLGTQRQTWPRGTPVRWIIATFSTSTGQHAQTTRHATKTTKKATTTTRQHMKRQQRRHDNT